MSEKQFYFLEVKFEMPFRFQMEITRRRYDMVICYLKGEIRAGDNINLLIIYLQCLKINGYFKKNGIGLIS